MSLLFLLVLASSLFLCASCAQVNCNTLGVQAHMVSCSPSFPSSRDGVVIFQANTSYVCKLTIEFNFTEQYHDVEYANLYVSYSSLSIPQYAPYGSFWASNNGWRTDDREGIVNSSITLVGNFSIDPNSIGAYYSSWGIMIHSFEQGIYCMYGQRGNVWNDAVFAPNAIVLNDAEVGDITPPYVFTIKTENQKYKREDTIRTFAYITDRSALMMENAWTAFSFNKSHTVSCPSSQWQNVTESQRNQFGLPAIAALPTYGVPPETQGWFFTECLIPQETVSGRYNMALLNIFDEYGNGVDTTGFWESTVIIDIA